MFKAKININPAKPIEELIGDNAGVMRMKIGRISVLKSDLAIIRKLWNKRIHYAPKELRRGWIKCALENIQADRDLYNRVMSGRI
jgi:hypothetical protein